MKTKYILFSFGTSLRILISLGIIEACWNMIRYLFVLLGLICLLFKRRFAAIMLLTSYIFYFSMITGHDGCGRFRVLFEFPLLILAAVGFIFFFNLIRKKQILIF